MSRSTKFKTGSGTVCRVRQSSTGVRSLEQSFLPKTMDRMDSSGLAPVTKGGCLFVLLTAFMAGPTWAYSGGTGTLQVPYVIATAEELIQLGQTPQDYDRHFLLARDIDLSGYTFEQAVIAPESSRGSSAVHDGRGFSGTLNGNGHVIRNLHVSGTQNLGLIGVVSEQAQLYAIGVVDAHVVGAGRAVGILAGYNEGQISSCFSSGTVSGVNEVGGLVGENRGRMSDCYTSARFPGAGSGEGLAGRNAFGGKIANCYSVGQVGDTPAEPNSTADGIGGSGSGRGGDTENCFWDVETSGLEFRGPGIGLPTILMQDIDTFLQAGWDFLGESLNGSAETWMIPEGGGYPVLTLFTHPGLLPTADGGLLGRCPLPLDVNEVLWDAATLFEAEWDTVSLARMNGNPAKHPELGPVPGELILTVSGRIRVLDGIGLLALSTDDSLVCHALDGEGNDVLFGGVVGPFTPSIECWQIFPTRPLPFTLQVRLSEAAPLPTHLSELEFAVSALYAQPLATFDIPFQPMTTPIELIPGFTVLIEEARSEDGRCDFTIKDEFEGFTGTSFGSLEENSNTCVGPFPSHRIDPSKIDLNYNVTMIDATGNPVSRSGGSGGASSSSSGDSGVRTSRGSWTDCIGIEFVRYTIAVRPYRVVAPLTLSDIPIPAL